MEFRQINFYRLAALMLLVAGSLMVRENIQAADTVPDLGTPSAQEMQFLVRNCPEIARIVSSGSVVAYGEVIKPPMVVVVDKDKIEINGIQVFPPQKKRSDYEARKIAGRIEVQYYIDRQRGDPDAFNRIEARLRDAKSQGRVHRFEVSKNKKGQTTIEINPGEEGGANAFTEHLPGVLFRRYHFLVSTVMQAFNARKETDGRNNAESWLRARLEELQSLGVIAQFEFVPINAVNIMFPTESFYGGWGIGDEMSPYGREYTKTWKENRKRTQAQADEIIGRLKENQILIYAFGFEKVAPNNTAPLDAIQAIYEGRDLDRNRRIMKERLALTDDQAKVLEDELRQ
jgi:hypothetical protein